MKMTRSRELLSFFLQIIIIASTAILIFSFVMNLTVASHSFYVSRFPSGTLAEECDAQLTKKFEMLSKESGFPLRVFEIVKTDRSTSQQVRNTVSNMVYGSGNDVYSEGLVDYFYNICEDYADGNSLNYNKDDLRRTAEKAARIYSDTVGFSNPEGATEKFERLRHGVTLAQFISFVSLAISGCAVVIMFTRKRLGYYKLLGGTLGGGLAVLLSSIALYLIKPVEKFNVTPQVFAHCFESIADIYFVISAFVAFTVINASLIMMIHMERKHIKSKDKVKIV